MQVGEVGNERFCVYLIPETLRATTLGEKGEGDLVNIEIDSQTQVSLNTARSMNTTPLMDKHPGPFFGIRRLWLVPGRGRKSHCPVSYPAAIRGMHSSVPSLGHSEQ